MNPTREILKVAGAVLSLADRITEATNLRPSGVVLPYEVAPGVETIFELPVSRSGYISKPQLTFDVELPS